MSKNINTRVLLIIISLFYLAVSVISCTSDPKATPAVASDVAIIKPTLFATSYSTLTPPAIRVTQSLTPTSLADDDTLFSPAIDDPIIAEVIQFALVDRIGVASFGGEPFCSYELFMPLQTETDGTIKAYMRVRCQEFYEDCGALLRGTGISVPVALTLEEREEGWSVEHQTPTYGSAGGVSIYDIFPPQAWPRISAPTGRTADGKTLSQNNIQQAEEYFGLPVNPTPRWFLPATPTKTPIPTSFVDIITLTPTPTLPALDILAPNLEVTHVNIFPKHHSYGNFLLFVQLGGALNHRLTSFQKGQLSSGWRVYMYQRRVDDDYIDRAALILDDVKDPRDSQFTFFVEITLEEIRNQFWEHRDLIYQIVDGSGNIVWQDEHYLILGLSPPPVNYGEEVAEGVVVGYPNLVSEDTARFKHQGKFIPIEEPRGGFYSLTYSFDFIEASGTTARDSELEALIDELSVTLFPYRDDGEYAIANSYALSKEVYIGGHYFDVHLPSDWLSEEIVDKQMFYLRIADGDENILREEYFHFIPYVQ